MVKKLVGDFPERTEQFKTDITHGRRRIPFGDELRHTLRERGVVIGGVLMVPDLARLATAMGLKESDIIEAGQRVGAGDLLDILSRATGYETREVSGYAIELDERAGPVVLTEPNVDLSTDEARSALADHIVVQNRNQPEHVLEFMGALATALAQTMSKE